jgi:hypothetical protein
MQNAKDRNDTKKEGKLSTYTRASTVEIVM